MAAAISDLGDGKGCWIRDDNKCGYAMAVDMMRVCPQIALPARGSRPKGRLARDDTGKSDTS